MAWPIEEDAATSFIYQEKFNIAAGNSDDANTAGFQAAKTANSASLTLTAGEISVRTLTTADADYSRLVGQQPAIVLGESFRRLNGNNATIKFATGSRGLWQNGLATWGDYIYSYLAADVVAGDNTFTLEAGEGAKWQAGDKGIFYFGSMPSDLPEGIDIGFFTVLQVVGDVITLNKRATRNFTLASVAGQSFTDTFGNTGIYNKRLVKIPFVPSLGITDTNFAVTPGTVQHHAIYAFGVEAVNLQNLRATGFGSAIWLHNCINAKVGLLTVSDARLTDGAGAPLGYFGRGITLSTVLNCSIDTLHVAGCYTAIFAEHQSKVVVDTVLFDNTGDAAGNSYGANVIALHATYDSEITARVLRCTGHGGYSVSEVYAPAPYAGRVVISEMLSCIHSSEVRYINLVELQGLFHYEIAGVKQIWNMADTIKWRRRLYLKAGLVTEFRGPRGVIKSALVYLSSGITVGTGNKLESFYIGKVSGLSANLGPQLTANTTVRIPFYGGTIGGNPWTYRTEETRIRFTAGSDVSLNTGTDFIDIELELAYDQQNPNSLWTTEAHAQAGGPGALLNEAVFPAYDLASIAAGATLQVDFAIPDMAATDLIEAIGFASGLTDITIRAMTAIAGNCRVVFENLSAAPIDKAATDVRILWRKDMY